MQSFAGSNMVVIKGNKPDDTNTITGPENIVPVTSKEKINGKRFIESLPPYSVTVIQLQTN